MTDAPPPATAPAKPLVASTTFHGLAIMLLAQLIGPLLVRWGVTQDGADVAVATGLVSLIGAAIASYGRITATHRISGIFKVRSK